MKNVEENLVAMHIQSLEMKLAGSDRLHEKINRLREEFAKSEVDHLSLKQEEPCHFPKGNNLTLFL